MQKLKKSCPRVTAILLSLMMIVVFVPTFAFAEDSPFSVSINNAGVEKIGTYGGSDAYYLTVPEGTSTLSFDDILDDNIDYAMIISNDGMQMLDGEKTAPLSDDWRIGESEINSKITLNEGVEAPDYSNAYLYFVSEIGEDEDSCAFIVSFGVPEEKPNVTFTAGPSWAPLTVTDPIKNGYTYHDYYGGTETVDLYTVLIPLGTTKVDLSFSENVLAYNYTQDGVTYIAGAIDDPYTGIDKATVDVNANVKEIGGAYPIAADNEFDVIQVQTPYKGSSSTLLFGITFMYAQPDAVETYLSAADIKNGVKATLPTGYTWENYPDSISVDTVATGTASFTDPAVGVKVENVPVNINTQATFTATVGSTKMTGVSCKKGAYTVKDIGLSPYKVDVYTVNIPYDTKNVDLAFNKNVLAYNYTSKGVYLSGYYDNYREGSDKATVPVNANATPIDSYAGTIPADNEIDYIYVQSPYSAKDVSTLQYVVTFKNVATKAQPMTVKAKTATLKVKKLKKKAQTLAVSKVMTVKNAQGKVTYTKISGNKKISINKTTGKVTVKKKLKKGTYKVKVKVNAAGYRAYKAGAKTVTFKIKVKK